MNSTVSLHRKSVVLPTYEPRPPDKNPMFLEKRVYQGSSGRVYPLPFYDRISETATPHAWDAVFIENEFIEVMVLPQLGGRIHRAVDKTNGYDFIYYQPVIKPALVGLAGPWASGGIEFNWPQHHRPSTYMACDVATEEDDQGGITAWFSEHDPMARMKGMHGVRLLPGRSTFELRVRVYNRTEDVQTHLWWANAAVTAHEDYQSFFPPDVSAVADHAKRAMSTYPRCRGSYYGVDYSARARIPVAGHPEREGNDLSWYANIPVPTSYMCMGSQENFFGGYDHRKGGGMIHIADHRIAPGKKQWTWGNHAFGHAWDRNLTDADSEGKFAPYLELMSGVFTDNQPDFSFLQPGETKAWSQWWYPIRGIGTAQAANTQAALSLRVEGAKVKVGAAVTSVRVGAVLILATRRRELIRLNRDLSPASPLVADAALPSGVKAADLTLTLQDSTGRALISYGPTETKTRKLPPSATEPPTPANVPGNDELYLIGLHLEQYRHATRLPAPYWLEAIRRDPGDSRSNLALGRWHLRRGEFGVAESYLRASIARSTRQNENPADGEAYYQLGLCLRHLDRDNEAYEALAKAAWNQAWQAASYHALAEIDCTRVDWTTALSNLERALHLNTDNLRARDLRAIALRKLGRENEAAALLKSTLELDPLDWWARHLTGQPLDCDNQVRLDLSLDCLRAGLLPEALEVLAGMKPEPLSGTGPLVSYYRAAVCRRLGDRRSQRSHLAWARKADPRYCFPSRLEEIRILSDAITANPRDARAPFYLGNLLYDRRRHREAIVLWERAVRLEPRNSVAWRNLGIGYFNILHSPARARSAYASARRADPDDGRLLYESDQLAKRLGVKPDRRLHELEGHRKLVDRRDDLSIELCALYNQTGRPAEALGIISGRRFQPWEGGEGLALGQHVRTHLILGRLAMRAGNFQDAAVAFRSALAAPENLGEAAHLLANQSEAHLCLGEAASALGDSKAARQQWSEAARFKGDFQAMSVRPFSELTYYSALAWRKLGNERKARDLLRRLLAYGRQLAQKTPSIDYFATSLPTMLLFDDDLVARQHRSGWFMQAQAQLGLNMRAKARRLLEAVLVSDPSHMAAADLLASMND